MDDFILKEGGKTKKKKKEKKKKKQCVNFDQVLERKNSKEKS